MKKLASLLVVAVLLVVSMVPAFAASGINDYEKKLIDYVQTAYVVDGKTITVPQEYITALENVFTSVDLTEEQYNEIKAILDEALAFVKSKNLVKLEDITKEGINAAMKAAASESFGYNEDQIVSSDVIGMRFGSLFDATQTMVAKIADDLYEVQVVSWYDNENSYTSQMVRTIKYFAELA